MEVNNRRLFLGFPRQSQVPSQVSTFTSRFGLCCLMRVYRIPVRMIRRRQILALVVLFRLLFTSLQLRFPCNLMMLSLFLISSRRRVRMLLCRSLIFLHVCPFRWITWGAAPVDPTLSVNSGSAMSGPVRPGFAFPGDSVVLDNVGSIYVDPLPAVAFSLFLPLLR